MFPDGEGVNRRIGFSDLTSEGQAYLKKQKQLALLSFANPAIFMINRINISPDFSFIAFLQYSPVHFGNDIAVFVPLKIKSVNQLIAVHSYSNRDKKFPEVQYGIYNISPFQNKRLELGGSVNLWVQPLNQGFFYQFGKAGGALELRSDLYLGGGLSVNLTAGYKTAG